MKHPRVEIPPVIEPLLPPGLIFDCDFAHINVEMKFRRQPKHPGFEDNCVTYGCIPLVCLRQCCTLIVRQIKRVGVSAVTPTNKILTIWPTEMEINNQIFPGLLLYRILDHRPTRMLLVAAAVEKLL